MSVCIYELSYKRIDALSRRHAEWLEHYVGANEDGKYVLTEEVFENAVKAARKDEREFPFGKELKGGYVLNVNTTDEIEKVLRRLVEKKGYIDLETSW